MMFRRSFCETGVGIAIRVIPELAERPGSEYDTDTWQGKVDVGVRVLLKMVGQLAGQLAGQRVDLGVECGDDRDARPGRGAVGRLNHLGCA